MTDIDELDEETIHTILSLTDIMILHFDRILYTCRGFSIVMATLRKSKAHTSHDFVSELFEEEGELSKIVCKDLFFQIYDPEDVMGFDSFLDELGNKNATPLQTYPVTGLMIPYLTNSGATSMAPTTTAVTTT